MMTKSLLALMALGFSTAALACPDYSGTYQWQGGGTPIMMTAVQKACESIVTTYSYAGAEQVRNMIFDGQKHVFADFPNWKSMESYTWDENGHILIDTDDHYFYPNWTIVNSTKAVVSLDASGDIIVDTKTFDFDGTPIAHARSVYLRQQQQPPKP